MRLEALVVVGAIGCADEPSGPHVYESYGTMSMTFSDAMNTNMNIEPFEAAVAKGTFGKAGYCAGGLHQNCYSWTALTLFGGDNNTLEHARVVSVSVALAALEPGATETLGRDVYSRTTVSDNYDASMQWQARGWAAKSGTLRINAVDGDTVAFSIEDALLEPAYIPADDETLGTFRMNGTGSVTIERKQD